MDLHVVHGLTRTCIDVVESDQTIKRVIGLGESTPLPRGASGKVLLAFDETGLIEALLEELGPAACKALRKECAEIKRNGYASTHGDRIPGASAIAVPLFEHQRPVRYCMTLAGPSFRIDAREEEFIAIMLKAGRAISERLGAVKAAAEINK
jgi:DNA-binding IclR family transcriptional regulator